MLEIKNAVRTASQMMLLWMAFYLFSALFAPRWIDFFSMAGCVFSLCAFGGRYRPYGVRNCRLSRYGRRQYALFFGLFVSGCALLSFLGALLARLTGTAGSAAPPDGENFLYALVFACVLPALFEELLLRCGILGALSPLGGAGVFLCGLMFGLMHLRLSKLPYTVFAGILLSALVFLTECVYIGMLFHFLNNFCALLLSYVYGFSVSCAFAAAFLAVFLVCLGALRREPIFQDMRALLAGLPEKQLAASLPPAFWIFVLISAAVSFAALFL